MKHLWIGILAFIGGLLVTSLIMIYGFFRKGVELKVVFPDKISVELKGELAQVRFPKEFDGRITVDMPTKFNADINTSVPAKFVLDGNISTNLPQEFAVELKNFSAFTFQCPFCKDGKMVPVKLNLNVIKGDGKIKWKCSHCGKVLE
ncbi:MAG: hypothetical protein QMD71_06705 [bacterium]|nr:hypothetical protein [bacterium]